MDWASFADWMLKGLMAGVLVYGVRMLGGMKDSMDELNKKMAAIIEKTSWHEKELDRQGSRITHLEDRLPRKKNS